MLQNQNNLKIEIKIVSGLKQNSTFKTFTNFVS